MKYNSDEAARIALLRKIRNRAEERGEDIQELIKKVAFSRFLARIFRDLDSPFILKGGYALELYFDRSRTTRDIDLVLKQYKKLSKDPQKTDEIIREALRKYADINLKDYFHFKLLGDGKDIINTLYGGSRYEIQAHIAARRLVNFNVDISLNDIERGTIIKKIKGEEWVGFLEVPPTHYSVLALEEIFAEKLHAYTLPRDIENSRVRDIVDMYFILIQEPPIAPEIITKAVEGVFKRRKTHPVPKELPSPPQSWASLYPNLAQERGLKESLEEIFFKVQDYFQANVR